MLSECVSHVKSPSLNLALGHFSELLSIWSVSEHTFQSRRGFSELAVKAKNNNHKKKKKRVLQIIKRNERLEICALSRKKATYTGIVCLKSAMVLPLPPPAGWQPHDARRRCT